jgi:hypothetical protein
MDTLTAVYVDNATVAERARIRKAQRQALRELRGLFFSPDGVSHRKVDELFAAIDKATRAPRKARSR